MKRFNFLILSIVFSFTPTSFSQVMDRASVASRSATPSANPSATAQCQADMQKLGCNMKDENVRDCTQDHGLAFDIAAGIGQCGTSTLQQLQDLPQEILTGLPQAIESSPSSQNFKFESQRIQFLKRCWKSTDCLSHLYQAAYNRAPSGDEVKSLSKTWWFSNIDYLWQRAAIRGGTLSQSSDPWFRQQVKELDVAAGTQSSNPSNVNLSQLIQTQYKKFLCLKREAQIELGCSLALGLASGAGAAKLISKYPRLAKLAELAGQDSRGSSTIKEVTNSRKIVATTDPEQFPRYTAPNLKTLPISTSQDQGIAFFRGNSNLHREYLQKADELGWDTVDTELGASQNANYLKEIVDKNIASPTAPVSDYAFHGTTSDILESLRKNGLSQNHGTQTPNRSGIYLATYRDGGHYTPDFYTAKSYAQSRATALKGQPMLLRWHLDKPEAINTSNSTSRVPPEALQYSLDGGRTWYKVKP